MVSKSNEVIYFSLINALCLFLAVLGLHRCSGFLAGGEWRLHSSCGVWTSLSLQRLLCGGAWALGTGSVVVVHRLSHATARRTFLDLEIKPVSPALAVSLFHHWTAKGTHEVIFGLERILRKPCVTIPVVGISSEGSNECTISGLYLRLCLHNSLNCFLKTQQYTCL